MAVARLPFAPARGRPRGSAPRGTVGAGLDGPIGFGWSNPEPTSALQLGFDALSAELEVTPDREETRAMEGSLRLFALSALPLFGPSEIRWGWAHDAVVEHLEAVTNGEIRNLVIDLPPRCLKSSLVSVCWPCWEWLRRPDLRYLFSSYDLNLTIRDNNYAREVIKSGWYQKRWADRYQISSSADAKRLFENDRTGRRLATSVRSRATGEGGDRLIVDDPHDARKVESDSERREVVKWWLATMSSRVNSMAAAKIITAQRTHHADLVGHVWADMLAGGEPYELLVLPMEYDPKLYFRPGEAEVLAPGDPDPLDDPDEYTEPGSYQPGSYQPGSYQPGLIDQDLDPQDGPLMGRPVPGPGPGSGSGPGTGSLRPVPRPLTLADFDVPETEVDALDTIPSGLMRIPTPNRLGFSDPRTILGELLVPEQWDADFVKRQKRNLGPIAYAAQYQQFPTPTEGGQFKEHYWRRYNFGVLWHQGLRPSMIFVDSAYGTEGGDPSGVAVWGVLGGRLYVMAAAELSLETPELRARLRDLHARWRVPFMIEKKANGIALIQDLRRGADDDSLPSLPVMEFSPDGMTKQARALSVVPYVAGGVVYLPEGADWVDGFIQQHKEFPKGRHDDLVDTTAMAICWLAFHADDIRELIGRPVRAPYGSAMTGGAGAVGGLTGGARAQASGVGQPYWSR